MARYASPAEESPEDLYAALRGAIEHLGECRRAEDLVEPAFEVGLLRLLDALARARRERTEAALELQRVSGSTSSSSSKRVAYGHRVGPW